MERRVLIMKIQRTTQYSNELTHKSNEPTQHSNEPSFYQGLLKTA